MERGLRQMTKMLTIITLAMMVLRLFASPSEANFSAAGDVTSEAMSCLSQCPLNPKTMSPSYTCVVKNCYKQLAHCAFDWTCRKTLPCMGKCTGQLAGVEDSGKFLDVQECLKGHCPGFPPNVACIAKNCKVVAAKCALNSKCRHALECANGCTPSIADIGLAKPEGADDHEDDDDDDDGDEELMVTDDANTTSDAMSCISQCPLDQVTMAPSYLCVIKSCFMKVGKCLTNSKCRNTLTCVSKCPTPLANTTDAHRFIEVETCVSDRCPGFPPSKLCVAAHCTPESANCGIHKACRTALMCADKCSSEEDLAITV